MITKLTSDSNPTGAASIPREREVTEVHQAHPGPGIRGDGILRGVENIFLRMDAWIHRAIPERLNPLTHSGAIANTAFLVAVVTGIWLLLWYSPSVHQAYESLERIRTESWLGQLVRSLHRYSSDACMFFILFHAARIVVARRIVGARWLAWVTGVALLALIWVIGWTGYWLVWDVRAQHVAEGTARFLDVLPVFGQPLASTFLTDASVPSLLFFLVFFAHMLLPLLVGVALWMHLSRLSRPKLITNRVMTAWILGTMVVMSVVFPATSAAPADMTALADRFTMDWWYLWPIVLTDRLGGGALWALFLVGTLAFVSVPWWMKKPTSAPAQVAVVDVSSCHGCTLCSKDCPFDAIAMVPRTDGSRFPFQSEVDPARCVGCGICTGACDSDAIGLPWLDVKNEKAKIDAWVDRKLAQDEKPLLAFVCAESAGSDFRVNEVSGECPKLPGYRVKAIPCAGWVSPKLIEHCLGQGAAGVLVAGCAPGEQIFREGAKWLGDRLAGKRRPILRGSKVDRSAVRFVQFDRTRPDDLVEAAEDFRRRRAAPGQRSGDSGSRGGRGMIRKAGPAAVGIGLAVVLATVIAVGSVLPYGTPLDEPELVISFRHLAERVTETQSLSAEELERLPQHMRREVIVDRRRAPVRMRVFAGENLLLDATYSPRGLRGDGPSIVLERIPMMTGVHDLRVEISDTADDSIWSHKWSETVEILPNRRRVLFFEGPAGFRLE